MHECVRACLCVCLCVQVGVPGLLDKVKRDSEGELMCVERQRQKEYKGDLLEASDEEIACVYVWLCVCVCVCVCVLVCVCKCV